MIIKSLVKFFALFWCLFCVVYAEDLYQDNIADLQQVEAYFNGLKTLKMRFTQSTLGDELAEGMFYLKRPDKIRLEYTKIFPLTIIVNGKFLHYYDRELDQKSSIPTSKTIASIITKKNFSFKDTDLSLIDVKKADGKIMVELEKANAAEEGSFRLFFTLKPQVKLDYLEIHSPEDDKTAIKMFELLENTDLPGDLFIVQDKSIM